jgi:hypothetical protein
MNNRDLYKAFVKAKMIYGCTIVHVQLIARQLNVLASEVVDYILANPSLVSYEIKTQASGYSNPLMGNEYTGLYVKSVTNLPFLTTSSVIHQGETGVTVVVDIEGANFEAASETESNWTVDVGNTGLTFAQAVKNSASRCTLFFTGTATLGNITIMAENAATTASVDSDVLTLPVSEAALDYTTVNALIASIAAVKSDVNNINDAINTPDTGILARLNALEET